MERWLLCVVLAVVVVVVGPFVAGPVVFVLVVVVGGAFGAVVELVACALGTVTSAL